jgi:hypothetical protein
MLRHARLRDVRQLGGAHISCHLYDPAGSRAAAPPFGRRISRSGAR